MKKIDTMLLKAFAGPFVLTFCVVVFIFLMQLLTQYLADLVSKDIDFIDYLKVFYYFALISVPRSMPLAVLLASLITFGNLGEFYELTALKSSGISAWRAMRSVFVLAVCITVGMYFYNDRVAPWANLKGYSLLYDIKTSKTTLNIKEGIFYNDIPGYSIKVSKKYPDGKTLKNLVIYRHPNTNDYDAGNRDVILADSGIMETINNKSYLVFELFKGHQYIEGSQNGPTINVNGGVNTELTRNQFDRYKMVVSLASFGIQRTDENQFKYHQYMKTTKELTVISDSLKKISKETEKDFYIRSKSYFSYSFRQETLTPKTAPKPGKWLDTLLIKKKLTKTDEQMLKSTALSSAQGVKSYIQSQKIYIDERARKWREYLIEWHHKFSTSFACLVMFLIGAPLGAIIKKGGFGMPILVGVLCFILSYVIMIQGDKWAKDGLLWVPFGAWLSNILLSGLGIYLITKAINDSRIFDAEIYIIGFGKMQKMIQESSFFKKILQKKVSFSK
jgi:lipopolysaccharide export system permease protein